MVRRKRPAPTRKISVREICATTNASRVRFWLADAVAAANAAVRQAPAELAPRVLLAELLLFAGNLERADVVLDATAMIDPQAAVIVAEFRQLVRADMARRLGISVAEAADKTLRFSQA